MTLSHNRKRQRIRTKRRRHLNYR